MQQSGLLGWAIDRIIHIIAGMFGTSWEAITVPLGDLDRYIETAGGRLSSIVTAILIAVISVGTVSLVRTMINCTPHVWRASFRFIHEIYCDYWMRSEQARELRLLKSADRESRRLPTPRATPLSPTPPSSCDSIDAAVVVAETPQKSRFATPPDTSPTPCATPQVSACDSPATPVRCEGGVASVGVRRDATPADVSAWASERLMKRAGSEIKAKELLQDFTIWCSVHGMVAFGKDNFGPALAALGYMKIKKKFVMYQNVALADGKPERRSLRSTPDLKVVK